jgi:predicted Ser/Thr protein kinase
MIYVHGLAKKVRGLRKHVDGIAERTRALEAELAARKKASGINE